MLKQEIIFKELKRRMNMLKNEGYEVVFIALQGSQNYNMDIYTEDYQSDIDCFACLLPSFEDFINVKSPISTTIVLENNEHIGLKDIRLMFELFRKQNQQYLELLFTDYRIINKKYKDIVNILFDQRENIAKINKKSLYNAIAGTAMNKFVALEHPYPSIKEKIEKYGYDGKQLHHLIRLSQFIHNIDEGMTFKESLTHFNGLVEMMCRNAKLNKYSLQEARLYASNTLEKVKEVANKVEDCKDNETYVKLLDTTKKACMTRYFKEQLLDKPLEKSYDFEQELNSYNNVFVTSDLHFGHENILKFENRTKKLNITTIKEHDQLLIDNWNKVVNKNDLVIIIGDFSFHKGPFTNEILKKLNGDKVLIEGNHDMIYLKDRRFDKSLYKAIYDYKEVKYKNDHLILMHYPIQQFKKCDKGDNAYLHLFGHIHSNSFNLPIKSFNVGVDTNSYTPVLIEKAIEKAKENNGGLINGLV